MDDGSSTTTLTSTSFGQRLVGLFFAGFASIFFIVGIGAALFAENGPPIFFLIPFLAIPGLFLLIGLYLLLSTEEVIVDRGRREIHIVSRVPLYTLSDDCVRFGLIQGITIQREIRIHHSNKGGSSRYEVWVLYLQLASGEKKKLSESSSEVEIRGRSEALAKATYRPIIDNCTSPPTIHQYDELDIPASESLRREDFERVYQLPQGHPVAETHLAEAVVFTWSMRNPVIGTFLLIFAIIWLGGLISGPGAGIAIALNAGTVFAAFFAVFMLPFLAAGLFLLGAGLLMFAGEQVLEVSARAVSLTTRLYVPIRTRTVSTNAIEEVRKVKRMGGPAVELVSDEEVLTLQGMGSIKDVTVMEDRLKTALVYRR